MHGIPGGGAGAGADEGYPDLFRGFTFCRETSFVFGSPSDDRLTRSMSRHKRSERSIDSKRNTS
eukprot:3426747-Prymnesium_polylepis.1